MKKIKLFNNATLKVKIPSVKLQRGSSIYIKDKDGKTHVWHEKEPPREVGG